YFSYEVSKNISVLCINPSETVVNASTPPYLNNLFGVDSVFLLKNSEENKLEYATLINYNLIVLNELKTISSGLGQELKRFLNNGGSVLIFPAAATDLEAYKNFLSGLGVNYYERLDTANTKVEKINLEHAIYQDIFDKKNIASANLDLPKVFNHYVFTKSTRSREEFLLRLQNGDDFLCTYKIGNGHLYLSAVPLQSEFSNFAKHALFVPSLYMIALNSQVQRPLFYTIGRDETMETTQLITGENVYHVRKEASDFDIIPEHKIIDTKAQINIHNQLRDGGNYSLYAGKEKIMPVSFNFNRQESDLTCYNAEELQALIEANSADHMHLLDSGEKNLTSIIDKNEGKKLWKWCIILTLLFLAVETLLLRLLPSRL
ncbi:MAG TPA: hypothetical protein VFF27_17375, partial [Bacteroidia bacterium]|nr:hypothetical protein [Bacteroidia bacterium]